jgi:hypothetical protein
MHCFIGSNYENVKNRKSTGNTAIDIYRKAVQDGGRG